MNTGCRAGLAVLVVSSWIAPGEAGSAQTAPGAVAAAERRPNVILVITDDQGYGDLGCHGNPMIRTPALDRLHAQSVRFTNFHVDPTCAPTRSALMTGRYSTRTGVWHTIMGRSLMYRDEMTLADVLAANGYRTACIGKWHLGDNHPKLPCDRGFHESVIHGGGGIGQTPDHWGNDYTDDHFLVGDEWTPFKGYCTDVFFDEALAFIERNRDRPFFLYLAPNVPHSPYRVPEPYRAACAGRGVPPPMDTFYGMIEQFDGNMARLSGRLDALGLAEDTILIFMTDNGTAAGVHRAGGKKGGTPAGAEPAWAGFNAGMRGTKGSQYDGGHRVPFFVRWPKGGIGGGRDVGRLAAHLDVLPTVADLCGLKAEWKNPVDGRSLVPLLRDSGASWPDRTLFVHVQREEIPPKWTNSAVLTDRWRLVNGAELYDMAADPGQAVDVGGANPAVVQSLRAAYEDWWAGLGPALGRFGHIVIGGGAAGPVRFTCMDWHAPTVREIPWDQPQIDAMPAVNGWWMLEVARAGRYAVTLRHKPVEAAFPLQATRARVRVGAVEASASVPVGAAAVTLTLDLPAGPARIETTLLDEASGRSRGAFFVDIAGPVTNSR
jgi:arylsulfatase A-like enzyme